MILNQDGSSSIKACELNNTTELHKGAETGTTKKRSPQETGFRLQPGCLDNKKSCPLTPGPPGPFFTRQVW